MTAITHRLSDALADRYRIERELGAGGMATVYLAHDIKHDRHVALKVLRPELAAVIGAERFLTEIKTTANLQHPHILPLFDSGQVDGTVFYAMPFIEGESLRDRLSREKQLPIADAVRIAADVAAGLDYAHRHGIIHRDIKPENILLHDGSALIADFGIALAASKSEGSSRMTETGMSLGTPHYMSPEQALGERDLDARTDVYALGCMLYEMLAGETPFNGPTAQAIIAKVMTSEPESVSNLRRMVPPHVAHAVRTAIQKLPADRFESAAKFAEVLSDPRATGVSAYDVARMPLRTNRPALLFASIALLAIAAALWVGFRAPARTSGEVNRFVLALPDGQALAAIPGTQVAFAPDGRSFVYPGPGPVPGRPQLWLRRLGDIDAVPIPGTDGATSPDFSPDGSEIGFVTISPFSAKVVSVTGGQARTLVSDVISGGGLTWAEDGYIYFDGGYTGLARVRADGTDVTAVMPLDTSKQEAVGWPSALPGGRGILLRVRRGGESPSKYSIVVINPRDGSRKHLVNGLVARYSPTGHLVWVSADGVLNAQRFNLSSLELTGSPVALANGIAIAGFGAAGFALAPTGDLIYATGANENAALELLWLSRDGKSARVDSIGERGLITGVALSPDGKSVALEILGQLSRIWVKRLGGGPTQLITSEQSNSRRPVWTPDGRDIIYSSVGDEAVYRRRADGSGTEQLVVRERRGVNAITISPDGRTLLLTAGDATGRYDLLQFRIGIDTMATPLIATTADERRPILSPDGRWLAYSSDESGNFEVYVRPFPNIDAQKVQVSVNGGFAPRWSARGDELFFNAPERRVVAAQVRTAPTFAVDRLTSLFENPGLRSFEVSPDGQRFLMLAVTGTQTQVSNRRLIVVQNFAAELNRRLPK